MMKDFKNLYRNSVKYNSRKLPYERGLRSNRQNNTLEKKPSSTTRKRDKTS